MIGSQVKKRIKINPKNIRNKTNLLTDLRILSKYKYSQENNKLIDIEHKTEKRFNIYNSI